MIFALVMIIAGCGSNTTGYDIPDPPHCDRRLLDEPTCRASLKLIDGQSGSIDLTYGLIGIDTITWKPTSQAVGNNRTYNFNNREVRTGEVLLTCTRAVLLEMFDMERIGDSLHIKYQRGDHICHNLSGYFTFNIYGYQREYWISRSSYEERARRFRVRKAICIEFWAEDYGTIPPTVPCWH